MKVQILKKIIKEGNTNGRDWKIRSLFVKFDNKETYDRIKKKIVSDGVTEEQAMKAVKENEYKEEISYVFYLNCSKFTFERVEKFGVIDAKIVFPVNDRGYINPKIVVEYNEDTKKWEEQILSYEEPKVFSAEGEEITGWAIDAPEPISEEKQANEVEGNSEIQDLPDDYPVEPKIDTQTVDDLPF